MLANPTTSSSSTWRKKRKRRKSKNKQQLQLQLPSNQRPSLGLAHQTVVNFPSSSKDLEQTEGECSKRDSSSSLGGPSARHTTLRESLLTVLGKLVVWKGTRYRPTPTNPATGTSTNSSSVPPNSPPATECIGRGTVFFSSGELFILPDCVGLQVMSTCLLSLFEKPSRVWFVFSSSDKIGLLFI